MTPPKILYKFYKEKRIKKISGRMFEVDNHIVAIQTKQGRKLMTCDCFNHTIWCNSPVYCWHKELVMALPIFEHYDSKIKEALDVLKYNKKLDVGQIKVLLDDLRV